MSIQKRPNGAWRARYRDSAGKEHAKHFKRKIDAQSWLDEVTAAVVTGTYVDPGRARVTVEAFFADWSQRQVWADNTAIAMSLAVRTCSFASVAVGDVRRSHVETWVKAMQADGLAASTIRTRVGNVRSVLRGALRDRLISHDPSDGVKLPRIRRAEHAMRIPSPDEVGVVLNAAPERFRLFIAVCAFAGLRLGEAAALQLGDVHFLKRQLHVARQVQRAGSGQIALSAPKHGSERVVSIADDLSTMIARHAEELGVRGGEQWLFTGTKGEPPHQNTVGYWWRKTLEDAGVEPFRLHDLRHFYASALIASGCDVVTVQRALGHAKATTTLDTYGHLWPTAEDRTRGAASDLMRVSLRAGARVAVGSS